MRTLLKILSVEKAWGRALPAKKSASQYLFYFTFDNPALATAPFNAIVPSEGLATAEGIHSFGNDPLSLTTDIFKNLLNSFS